MAYELGDKDKTDELYEWVFAHTAAFGEVISNFRRALSTAPSGDGVPAAGYLPAVKVLPSDTLPSGPDHLVSKAWVHEGCAIALYGTNDKMIGWIDTHEWVKGRVYRDRLLSGDGVPGMVLDPATIEACAAVADDHTPAKHEGTLAAHVTGRTISNAIRALSTASSTGKETP